MAASRTTMGRRADYNTPGRCDFTLVAKRVWDTSGSRCGRSVLGFHRVLGWCSNRYPRLIPHGIPHRNRQRMSPCVCTISSDIGAHGFVALLQAGGQVDGVWGGCLVDFGEAGGEQGQGARDRVEMPEPFL